MSWIEFLLTKNTTEIQSFQNCITEVSMDNGPLKAAEKPTAKIQEDFHYGNQGSNLGCDNENFIVLMFTKQ